MNTTTCNGDELGAEIPKNLDLPGFKQVKGGWFLSWGGEGDKVGFELSIKKGEVLFSGGVKNEG